MKRFSAVFLAALLMVGQIVPAYAAGYDFSDWVPPNPYDVPDAVIRFEDFIIAFGGGK